MREDRSPKNLWSDPGSNPSRLRERGVLYPLCYPPQAGRPLLRMNRWNGVSSHKFGYVGEQKKGKVRISAGFDPGTSNPKSSSEPLSCAPKASKLRYNKTLIQSLR